jgi:four helix bundle protein
VKENHPLKEPWELRDRTKSFALRIIRLYVALPKTAEAQVIGRQVLRSGTSIGAHYREASRARSDAEFVSKIGIALQELDETAYWLELLLEAEIVPAGRLEALQQETGELIAIFTTVVKKVKSKNEGRKHKDEGRRIKEEEPAWEVDETELLEYSDEEEAYLNKMKPDADLDAR